MTGRWSRRSVLRYYCFSASVGAISVAVNILANAEVVRLTLSIIATSSHVIVVTLHYLNPVISAVKYPVE